MRTLIITILIAAVPASASEPDPVSASSLGKLGASLYHAGQYAKAEKCFTAALSLAQTANDPGGNLAASLSLNLAAVYRSQARYADSELLYSSVLRTRESQFGMQDPALLPILRGLGVLYKKSGKLALAEEVQRRALKILDEGATRADLAGTLLAQGKYREAESFAREAAAMLEAAGQQTTSSYAETLNSLGLLCRIQSRYVDAKSYYLRSEKLLESLYGPEHPSIAPALSNIAQVVLEEGDWRQALTLSQRAVAIWEKGYGPNHPDLASGLTNLGGIYLARKHYEKAASLYNRALGIDTNAFGPSSARVALDINNLASVAYHRNRLNEAETLFARAFAIDETTLGPDHIESAMAAANLAVVYIKQKRFAEAEPLVRKAAMIYESAFGPDDPRLAKLLESYALVLRQNQNYSEAAAVDLRATRIRTQSALHAGSPWKSGAGQAERDADAKLSTRNTNGQ